MRRPGKARASFHARTQKYPSQRKKRTNGTWLAQRSIWVNFWIEFTRVTIASPSKFKRRCAAVSAGACHLGRAAHETDYRIVALPYKHRGICVRSHAHNRSTGARARVTFVHVCVQARAQALARTGGMLLCIHACSCMQSTRTHACCARARGPRLLGLTSPTKR